MQTQIKFFALFMTAICCISTGCIRTGAAQTKRTPKSAAKVANVPTPTPCAVISDFRIAATFQSILATSPTPATYTETLKLSWKSGGSSCKVSIKEKKDDGTTIGIPIEESVAGQSIDNPSIYGYSKQYVRNRTNPSNQNIIITPECANKQLGTPNTGEVKISNGGLIVIIVNGCPTSPNNRMATPNCPFVTDTTSARNLVNTDVQMLRDVISPNASQVQVVIKKGFVFKRTHQFTFANWLAYTQAVSNTNSPLMKTLYGRYKNYRAKATHEVIYTTTNK